MKTARKILVMVVGVMFMVVLSGCGEANLQTNPTSASLLKWNDDGLRILSFEQNGIYAGIGGAGSNAAALLQMNTRSNQKEKANITEVALRNGTITNSTELNATLAGF